MLGNCPQLYLRLRDDSCSFGSKAGIFRGWQLIELRSEVICRMLDVRSLILMSDAFRYRTTNIKSHGCHKVPESFLTYHRLFEQNP